jgi:hypothetical protein
MDWEPVQQNLGALGFAGICRETYRVLLHAIRSSGGPGAAILSALFLAHIAANRAILSWIVATDFDLTSLIAQAVTYSISEVLCLCFLLLISLVCNAIYGVLPFCVATLYCTDGDSGATKRILTFKERLIHTFISVVPLAIFYIALSTLAWLELPQLDTSDEVVVLPLQLLGGAAFLAGAAYVSVVSHMSCVVAVLEDAVLFGAVGKSRSLLAGKFWAAAGVFVPLDGCFVALQMYFLELVLDDALGLGPWFQVAAGAAMAVALWAVVVLTMVAQPVVYLVCKNHHNEVADNVHLNFAGEYKQLAVDGVELQPVTVQIAETTQSPGQAPAGS